MAGDSPFAALFAKDKEPETPKQGPVFANPRPTPAPAPAVAASPAPKSGLASLSINLGKPKESSDEPDGKTASAGPADGMASGGNVDSGDDSRSNPAPATPAPASLATLGVRLPTAGVSAESPDIRGAEDAAGSSGPVVGIPVGKLSLDTIAKMDTTDIEAKSVQPDADLLAEIRRRFPDQTPVKPLNRVPIESHPDDTEETIAALAEEQKFVELLDGMYDATEDPEFFAQVVRGIMQELGAHPEYKQQIMDEDVATIVRHSRESAGVASIKKTQAKKAATPRKKKSKLDATKLAMADDFFKKGA